MVTFSLSRSRAAALGLAFAAALSVAGPMTTSTFAAAVPDCQFVLGFKALHDADPADVGNCTSNQAFASNGDAQQATSYGLMAWRKTDNFTAFTNGFHTWVNGPFGVQERLNSQRFPWEGDGGASAPAAAPQSAQSGMAEQFFNLLNSDRQENSLRPLALNGQLSELAQNRAQSLLGTNGAPLNHYDSNGQLVLREIVDGNHIPYQSAGENLAENNYDASQTVTVANTGLMHSSTHRANILNPGYNQVGVALAGPDPQGRYYYVQLFLQTA